MARTRIKICGLTRAEDAVAAARAGADAVGLVFHPTSQRALSIDRARAIVAALPPYVDAVGVFVDAPHDRVEAVLGSVALDVLQFHGGEDAEYCRSFGRGYIKAVGMAAGADLAGYARAYPDARALLGDSHANGQGGGTGQTFAWSRIPAERGYRLVLAGGLTAENVGSALAAVRPDAVDVSSGVESAPGRKSAERIERFIEEVRRGDRNDA